jgi:hypothetical protein
VVEAVQASAVLENESEATARVRRGGVHQSAISARGRPRPIPPGSERSVSFA